jgi:AAHS family 4-hydroxybenzoate transporter-like MFS transporter
MVESPASIASARSGWRRLGLLAGCLLLTMIDGFDTQSIGFVGPAIIRAWHLSPASLGPIFSAGLFGALVGAVGCGRLGDRFGRLRMLAFSVLLFAAGMMATAWAGSAPGLVVLRFLTGIGLGGALPNLLALAAGQAPARFRATSLSAVLIGIPLGASIGGFSSVALIEARGWQAVFVMGGLVPLPILLMVWALASYPVPLKIDVPSSASAAPSGFAAVLAPRYRAGTLLLWSVTCCCAMLTYTLASWLPTLLTERGFAMREAVLATGLLNLGAVLGGAGCGRLSDLRGPYPVIAAAYVLGAAAIAMIGVATGFGFGPVLVAIFTAAVLALGGQTGVGVLSTVFYDAPLRATGVGLALGFGRVGAALGPLLIGMLLAAGTRITTLFLIGGGVALLIAFLVTLMAHASRTWSSARTAA